MPAPWRAVRASTVGLIVHQIDDPYFSEIAGGVVQVAGERDLIVQICHFGRNPQNELRQIRHLVDQRVGVIIIAGSGYVDPRMEAESRAELSAFQDAGGRLTVIGRHFLNADAVRPDNKEGAETVTGHLLVARAPPDRRWAAGEMLAVHGRRPVRGGGGGAGRRPDFPPTNCRWHRPSSPATAGVIDGRADALRDHPASATAIVALNDAMALGVLASCSVPTRRT